MIYKVVRYLNNPILERVADPVTEFDTPELHQLVEDMFETMYSSRGIGLAAPQIDVNMRLAVADISVADGDDEDEAGKGNPEDRIVLINPRITSKDGRVSGEEGCLSIPGFREPVSRAKKIVVRAQDVRGDAFEIEAEDLLARVFQHEIDHLNGVLFINHLSSLKRDLIRRKIRKMMKAGEWE